MADFLSGITRFNEALDSNPDFQAARLRRMGADPLKVEAVMMPAREKARGQRQLNEILAEIGDGPLTEADIMQLFAADPQMAEFIVETKKRQAPASTAGKIQADIAMGLLDPETGAAALKKATTIAPVYDPVTQRLIYAGGQGFNAPQGGGMTTPSPAPAGNAPDYYGGGLPEPTQIPVPEELPDDSANLVESALSQIPPQLATENPALYQSTAAALLKDIPEQKQKLIGKKKFESAINQMQDILAVGAQKGFLTSESKPLTENIMNRAFSTESGKSLSDFIGNDRATFAQTADSVRSSIMSTMMQAYGLGATQLNTLKEMEMIMKQVVDGKVTQQAGEKLLGLLREREGFAPRYDRGALEAEAKRRGLRK